MPRDLDKVLADLAEVQDQLIALPDEAFGEKAKLQSKQDELRAEAREARHSIGDHLDIQALRDLVQHLERELQRYLDARPAASVGQGGGGPGGGGIDPEQYHEMVGRMDKYVGYDKMRAELQELRVKLSEAESAAPED